MQLSLLLFVAAGGAFGALARYVLSLWIQSVAGNAFPYATLIINVLGAFLLGVLIAFLVSIMPRGKELYVLVGLGALGGFTTFSTFAYETYMLLERSMYAQGFLYIFSSVAFSVFAFWAGMLMLKALVQ